MISDAPLLIVTLPGRTVEEVRAQVEVARSAGADVAEVRFDRWSAPERARLPALFPSRLPLMATLRSRAEGGEGPDDSEVRRPLLETMAAQPFRWLDLEETRDTALLASPGSPADALRVVSTHLPAGSAAPDLIRRVRERTVPGAIRKVVMSASIGELLEAILPALRATGLNSAVVLTTGPSGALLRAWAMKFHYPFVYASLPESPVPDAPLPVEVSQIPVDRLRSYFDHGGASPLFGVAGHPVAHSRSPFLHSRWMRAGRHAGIYVALDFATESEFVESLDPLIAGGFRGLNVTHPWKHAAFAAATRVGRGAERCGTANCLTFRDDEVEAENTDLVAILRRLEELRRGDQWDGKDLAVVGSGGAAAATLGAARELGASAYVMARSAEKARALAERLGAHFLDPSRTRRFALVVHATSVGRAETGALEAPLAELLEPGSRILDWVYSPTNRTVKAIADSADATHEDGWRLLVYQAAASFGIWWGEEPPTEEVDRAVAEGPCAA
jgi:shikimate dehydrogenase